MTKQNGTICKTNMPGPVLAGKDRTTIEGMLNYHLRKAMDQKQILEPSKIDAIDVFLASIGAASITCEEIGVTGGI
ncbi:hypothetical protein [Peribacillus simplex]|uniref:hypothetical protein n=1 Tax=Peribacillus simplex TaxID=1478 RepID=UPI0024BF2AE7|nr:hypothetical protein [Peribacillus simplex]WHY96640.1 hypothetical protein QNH37_22120 [Peribacillus simplex]